ncbi:hypothetical protein GRI34_13085 [Erythrobacter aquimaris]|uniref:Uncharacterized protein n=1 Tax=Qipengyuania aquimaris TaxID=255984 RepID=A0A6I4TQB5_9SPHN|nr:hypothetical protein [Qipengyuania aquimaris]MXO97350.1 hypothetical protein [Qipengyuania aquimaris]
MRWLFAIGSLLILAGVTYYLIFADRSFGGYGGARQGMAVDVAVEQLRVEGWTLLSSSSTVRRSDCAGNERYYLVQLRSPDFTLTLTADENCKVSNIARKRRGIEL